VPTSEKSPLIFDRNWLSERVHAGLSSMPFKGVSLS